MNQSTRLALAGAALLAGCAGTGGIAPTHQPLAAAQAADAPGWPDPARDGNAWVDWKDPALDRLIAGALAHQPSLQVVQLRLQQARAQVEAANSTAAPQVGFGGGLSDTRITQNGLYPPPYGGALLWNNNLQFNATWEWDLFGRQRATIGAALGQQRAAEAEAQAASMLLAANIASAWVGLARALELHRLAHDAAHEREQVLAIVRERVAGGLDTEVELREAQGLVAQARVETAAADQQIARARHALAEMSGQQPDALADLAPALDPLRSQALPAGLPFNLLGRRADIVAQRWRVESAARGLDLAHAQFYPDFNLSAFWGLSSLGLGTLLKSGSQTYGIGPAISLPVFDGGALRANLKAKSAEVDIAIEDYNATLLRAWREAADEISDLRTIEAQQHEQRRALGAAESTFELAQQRYRAGLGNFLVVLTAESNVLVQRRAAADLKARHLQAEVALSRALGGGVKAEPPVTASAAESTR